MEQVEEICESICLINKGQNVLEGKVKDIKNMYRNGTYSLVYDGLVNTSALSKEEILEEKDGYLKFILPSDQGLNERLGQIISSETQILELKEVIPTLNDIFISKVLENA